VLAEASAVVQGGGVLAFPTDTVYSLGCDPYATAAVERIHALKGDAVPLALYLATVSEALEYVNGSAVATMAIRRTMPGPIAFIVPHPWFMPEAVTRGRHGIGLRVPDHPLATALLEACGPLTGSSAGRAGEPPFIGEDDSEAPPDCDLLILDGPAPRRARSTIVDLTWPPQPRVIRSGAIPIETLEETLGTRIIRPYPES
jgi:L-threonylcarbamoyladenylate synthase